MKSFFLLLALLFEQGHLFAQNCQQIDLSNTPQRNALLREYIKDCKQKRYFIEDKGIVKLIIYQDAGGATCWYLSAIIDDRYRILPPAQYAFLANDVILVYQGDSVGHPLPISGDATSRDVCIQDIIGGRVYARVTKKQFVYSHNADGKVQKVPVTYVSGGNSNNDLIVRFNKDGTISKFTPV